VACSFEAAADVFWQRGIAQRAELGELSIVHDILLERHAAAGESEASRASTRALSTNRDIVYFLMLSRPEGV